MRCHENHSKRKNSKDRELDKVRLEKTRDEVKRFLESVEFHGQDVREQVHCCTLDELVEQLEVLEKANNAPGLCCPSARDCE